MFLKNKKIFLLFSFIFPLILVSLYYILCGIMEKNILPIEYQLSQVCFLGYFKSLFTSENNILYSFHSGGEDMALFSSIYVFSPWNLISFFFPDKYLDIAFTTIISLKFALCSLSLALLLCNRIVNKKITLAVSVCYGLLACVLCFCGFYFLVDFLYLIPLILICIHKYFSENKKRFLSIPIIISVLLNIYTGFFITVFIVLYFLWDLFKNREKENVLERSKTFFCTIILSVLSLAFIWLPIVKNYSWKEITYFIEDSILSADILSRFQDFDTKESLYLDQNFSEKYALIEEALNVIKKREKGNDNFYRVEVNVSSGEGRFLSAYTNEALLHNFNSISQYAYSGREYKSMFWQAVGFPVDFLRKNISVGGAEVFPMSFASVKYILSDNPKMQQPYKQISYFEYSDGQGLYLYENPYVLPLGLIRKDTIVYYIFSLEEPYIFQNFFIQRIADVNYGNIYKYYELSVDGSKIDWEHKAYHLNTTVQKALNQYFVFTFYTPYHWVIKNMHTKVGDEEKSFSLEDISVNTVYTGVYEENQPLKFDMYIKDDFLAEEFFFKIGYENLSNMKKYFDKLLENKATTRYISSSRLKTTCDIKEDGTFVIYAIPFDKAWHAEVDGEIVNPRQVCGCILAVPVNAGKHEIDLVYIPEGLFLSIYISVLALVLLFLI